jgi:hypothetical protein
MKINRDEARQHLQAGRPVAFRTPDGQGRTLTLQFGRKAVQALPPEDVEGTYHLMRDEQGNLTRAGMEQVIREGGSVMHQGLALGEVIESIEDLPDEVDLVKGNERARKALAESLDAQLVALTAQRARLDAPDKPDEETPALKQARQAQEERTTEEEKARREGEQKDIRPEHQRDRQRESMMASALSPQHEQAMLAEAAAEQAEESEEQGQASTQQAAERRTQAQQQRRERERREREAQQPQREVED